MLIKHFACLVLFAGSLCAGINGALAQDTGVKPHVPLAKTVGQTTAAARPVPSLAVINSAGAKLDGNKLTLSGVTPNVIVFADRPVRAAGHMTTEQFIMQWDEGKDNFALDPPNATVSILGGDGSKVSDAVVTLKSPQYKDGNLTFDVAVLEGSLGDTGPAALFIDAFGFHAGGFHAGGFGGVGGFHAGGFHYGGMDAWHGGAWHGGAYWHAPVYHGAWYGAGAGAAVGLAAGAALGAAAAAPYYDQYRQCGYYPYPPCY